METELADAGRLGFSQDSARNIPQEVDEACRLGGGPLRYMDLFLAMMQGTGALFIGDKMHGSVLMTDKGLEIFHVYGDWDDEDARWLLNRAAAFASERGVAMVVVNGRTGWRRFLRIKGLTLREGAHHGRSQ